MILGFTGTQRGMTERQRATVLYLFNELQLAVLHHGDCVGADAQAHKLAIVLNARIVLHPPNDDKLRAFCGQANGVHPPKPYLARNRDIVREAHDGLVAAPKGASEEPRSGTWATVRYARKACRKIWIVLPDGTFYEDLTA